MSEIVGMLRERKIYADDPALTRLQCDVEYIPIWGSKFADASNGVRCDYCRKAVDKCGCGACK